MSERPDDWPMVEVTLSLGGTERAALYKFSKDDDKTESEVVERLLLDRCARTPLNGGCGVVVIGPRVTTDYGLTWRKNRLIAWLWRMRCRWVEWRKE